MEKIVRAELIRVYYTPTTTFGKLSFFDEAGAKVFTCDTLEDTVRPLGIKIKHHTAIYAGIYSLVSNFSPKFKRILPFVRNTTGFTGIRFHCGKSKKDTSGCIIVGVETDYNKETISNGGAALKQIITLIGKEKIPFIVTNSFQVE